MHAHKYCSSGEAREGHQDWQVFKLFQWWNNSALVAPRADIISGVSHFKL